MTIELWCLFVAALLHVFSKVPLFRAQVREGSYDNNLPRTQQAKVDAAGQRALAAHQNQIESFPLFAAGVLVVTTSGVSHAFIAYFAIAYIFARIAYIYCYVQDLSTARSLIWMIGYLSSIILMISPLWATAIVGSI